ncbi:taurine ABC transporter, periplasmic binding protein [Streptomyces viridochromogenes DSM 40736]|uniref:Taurine ABC transporter, periplasmic binding protein n=1 Tax=Streptomyces viridochromogenes (strain DSM 40736 / JCM 4977 / BCRC 1201 / Tue 494) TaxID=591159 RepID=D9XGB6_STRVT|nr:ABC transporter substrate-binding protein [Streptomyces viridochromogenes]EFL37005.1 taurine ABC transporter, periplasmic binding protein [Streptomyces viridochromogenes DSM 40736]
MSPASRGPSRRLLLGGALAAASAAVTGCSSGSGASTSGGSKRLRIGYFAFPSGDLLVKNRKLLEKALPDYEINWIKFDSGASVNQAFIGKSLDIAALGSSPFARGVSGSSPIPYKVAWILDVAGDNEALVARKATGISDVAGLKGKKIATPFASTSHYSLLSALKGAGLKQSDVELIDLQPQPLLAAWQRGDIDAAYVWLPTLDELRKTGTQLTSSKEIGAAGKPTLDLAVVSDDLIARDPKAIDAWRKAEAEALRLIKSDPDGTVKAVAAELGISAADAKAQLSQGVFLTPEQVVSADWLGTDGSPGKLLTYVTDTGRFLADQKQIGAAPSKDVVREAFYLKGLPDVLK